MAKKCYVQKYWRKNMLKKTIISIASNLCWFWKSCQRFDMMSCFSFYPNLIYLAKHIPDKKRMDAIFKLGQ